MKRRRKRKRRKGRRRKGRRKKRKRSGEKVGRKSIGRPSSSLFINIITNYQTNQNLGLSKTLASVISASTPLLPPTF